MIHRYCCLLLASLLPIGICGAETLYKSIDEQGRVTYSSHPPADAVETKDVQIEPGPSAEETEQARARAGEIEQASAAQYEELLERRREEAEARKEAQRERAEREAAERKQQLLDAWVDTRPYGYGWRWPYRPRPPIYPPYPPRPVYPIRPPSRPYTSHINPPTRDLDLR